MVLDEGWQCLRGRPEIEALAPAWHAAAVGAGAPAIAYPAWVLAFADSHPDYARTLQLYVEYRQQQLLSVIPLMRVSTVTGRSFNTGTDSTWPYFSAVLGIGGNFDELLALLLKQAGSLEWASLRLLDPIYRQLLAWGNRHYARCRRRRVAGEALITLTDGWDGVASQISGNLLRDMRQGDKRLRAAGAVEFAAISDAVAIAALLPEFLSLEMRGWKGDGGTAIVQTPVLLAFYNELARRAVGTELLCLYTLRVAGTLVAGELTLRAGGRIEVLKIAYDETRAAASPGTVLRAAILRDALATAGFDRYCLGRPSAWKSRWV